MSVKKNVEGELLELSSSQITLAGEDVRIFTTKQSIKEMAEENHFAKKVSAFSEVLYDKHSSL